MLTWTFFYQLLASIAICVSEYTFLISKKKKQNKTRRQKEKEAKEGENLTGFNDIVCEVALCTFNLLDRVVNFCWLSIWTYVVYEQRVEAAARGVL